MVVGGHGYGVFLSGVSSLHRSSWAKTKKMPPSARSRLRINVIGGSLYSKISSGSLTGFIR